jgi:hypothetical protein
MLQWLSIVLVDDTELLDDAASNVPVTPVSMID